MTLQQHDHALILYANLDHALRSLGALDDDAVDLAAARAHVGRALQGLYRAFARGADREAIHAHIAEALGDCRDALAAVQREPTDDPRTLHLQATLARCLEILSFEAIAPPRVSQLDLPPAGDPVSAPVALATVGAPALLVLDRNPILPTVALPEKGLPPLDPVDVEADVAPDDVTLEALAAQAEAMLQRLHGEPPPAPPPAARAPEAPPTPAELDGALFGVQLTREALLRERAADFFEDLSMMGVMRQPEEGDRWAEMRDVERRLLARVDALAACGPASWGVAVAALEEAALEDPDYVWGAMMLYGSVAGDDTFDQLLRVVSAVDLADDGMRERVADGWAFVPHPRAEAELARWLRSSDPARVGTALRAMGRRRALDLDEALAFAAERGDPAVAAEALRALALAPYRVEPHRLLDALARPEPEVLDAALEAALAHGAPLGVERARELVAAEADPATRAPLWLALGGNERDFEALLGYAAATGAPVALEALGWFGHLGAVDFLVGRLRGGADAAVGALQRLTAANLTDDAPAPDYDGAPRPFERYAPPAYEPEVSGDAEVWAAWWARWRRGADERRRHRFGHPFALRDLVWELREGWTSPAARRLAALECSTRSTCRVPLDPGDFVPRQASLLGGVEPILAARAHRWPEGAWVSEALA